MKKKFYRRAICPLLLVATLIVVFKPSKTSEKKITYSGIELFKGIFFQEGAVAGKLPEFAYAPKAKLRNAKQSFLHKQLLARLIKDDARFLENFKKDIQSGDPITIQSCLLKSSEAVTKQLKNISDEEAAKSGGINSSLIGAEKSPAVFNSPMNLPLVITPVAIVIAIGNPGNVDIRSRSLQSETLVFAIARDLKN